MKLRVFTLAGLLSLSAAASSYAAPLATPAGAAVAVEGARAPAGTLPGSRSEERRYAAREASSPQAKDYRGGDVIVISASALAVILLVILVIVLI